MIDDFETLSLGNKKLKENDITGAMQQFHSIIKENKNHIKLYQKNFDLLCKNKVNKQNFEFLRLICEFYFKDNYVFHQLAFQQALKLTKFADFNFSSKHSTSKLINRDVLNDELFQLILKKCLVMDIDLELYLKKLRKVLLKKFLQRKDTQLFVIINNFLISFAEQCFFNEFIYSETDEEKKLLAKLKKSITESKDICELSLIIYSFYKPLYKLEFLKNKLSSYQSNSSEFNDFLKFVYHDPIQDKKINKSLKSMSSFANKTSKLMMSQYEENPYPRWRFTAKPIPDQDLNAHANHITDSDFYNNYFNKPKILIAGCGTGQQIIGWSAFKNSQVIAVDLSRESLAYSIRKSEELNIKNVKHYHLDLLDLKLLNQKFDMIISTGVLHHMEKPEDGLASLSSVLKPNGIMLLGLYSKYARSEIKWIREYIEKNKIILTEDNMKKFREKMLISKNKKIQYIRNSVDFFSLSNFRDLIFNYHEHRYDLIEIKELLKSNKLNFLYFNGLDPDVLNRFLTLYQPTDEESRIDAWSKYESIYPKTFFGMYKFWVKKIN